MQLETYFGNINQIQKRSIANAKTFGKRHKEIHHYFPKIKKKKDETVTTSEKEKKRKTQFSL